MTVEEKAMQEAERLYKSWEWKNCNGDESSLDLCARIAQALIDVREEAIAEEYGRMRALYETKIIPEKVAEERERCAKLVQEMGKSVKGGYNNAAHEMATAIRERK